MKSMHLNLFLLFILLLMTGCGKDTAIPNSEKTDNTLEIRSADNRDVCHKGNIINVSVNAIPAHRAHGDAVDMDGDGYFDGDNPCSETDCDDTNAAVNPDATEVIYDGIDNDCNPETLDDDLDQDGYNLDVDCDDTNPVVNPGVEEVCGNGIDDNCNGAIDENCADPCLNSAINQVIDVILGLGGTDLTTTITGSNSFVIHWNSGGRDGRGCIETTAEATDDPLAGCVYTNLHHVGVSCL